MTTISLQAVNLRLPQHRGRPAQHILTKLHLTIPTGQITWLIGESGAGKSSCCDLLAGLYPARARISGQLMFQGQTHELGSRQGRRQLARWRKTGRLAWTPQNPADTFAPGVKLATWFHNAEPDLAPLGLDSSLLQRTPQALSDGQTSRLSLAVALQHDPQLLICDEPTAGLDGPNAEAILRILQQHAARGRAVLATTHDLSSLHRAAQSQDQAAIIFAGHIIETCPLALFLTARADNAYSRALARAAPALGAQPLPAVSLRLNRAYQAGDEIRRLQKQVDRENTT